MAAGNHEQAPDPCGVHRVDPQLIGNPHETEGAVDATLEFSNVALIDPGPTQGLGRGPDGSDETVPKMGESFCSEAFGSLVSAPLANEVLASMPLVPNARTSTAPGRVAS